jgi:hypothetical protein
MIVVAIYAVYRQERMFGCALAKWATLNWELYSTTMRWPMLDYSEILLNIQKTHRQCHEAMLKRDWHAAKDLAIVIQLQAATLENLCQERENNGNVG